jgi:hypothetical protein
MSLKHGGSAGPAAGSLNKYKEAEISEFLDPGCERADVLSSSSVFL